MELRKQTVVENIYGVDIVEPAVEIAKLRLWLSIIAEVDVEEVGEYSEDELALPNVVFNVRQGNSLIGYTELMETSGDGDQARLSAWGPDSVRQRYGKIITKVSEHKRAETTEEAQRYLREAEELLSEYRVDLDEKVLADFREAGVENINLERVREFEPFHWVLEFASVYADGGFDIVVGNPPWNRLKPGNNVGLERQIEYFNKSPQYELQTAKVAGRTQASENDLSSLFLERVLNLSSNQSRIAQLLPGRIFTGGPTKSLREHLFDNTRISSLIGFENHGIFSDIDTRYNFGVITFSTDGYSDSVPGILQCRDLNILQDIGQHLISIPVEVIKSYSPNSLLIPQISDSREVGVLQSILSHPSIGDTSQNWFADACYEVHITGDSDRLFEEKKDYPVLAGRNCYLFSYNPRFISDLEKPSLWSVNEEIDPERSAKRRNREKNYRRLKRGIYDAFDGTGTQKSFVNELLTERRGRQLEQEDVLLDCTEYRIGFRRVARSSDERTMISAVIPPGVICHSGLPVIRPFKINPSEGDLIEYPCHRVYDRIFTDRELFVAAGLLNSLPFDFLMRSKIDNSIPMYSFKESQMPRLTEGDNWFEYISSRAARLNCYGEAFTEMRERLGGIDPATDPEERKRLQAEIDAAAFQAYGLDREETQFVCDDFHRVQNPRLMTDDYFDLVLEKYDELADNRIDAEQEQ